MDYEYRTDVSGVNCIALHFMCKCTTLEYDTIDNSQKMDIYSK